MAKYIVTIPIQHYEQYEVEASNPDDAIQKVIDGKVDPLSDELSYDDPDMDTSNWKVFGTRNKLGWSERIK